MKLGLGPRIRRSAGALTLLGGIVALSHTARANPLDFLFSYSGGTIAASGEFFTNGVLNNGAYTITGITGTRNGRAITGLVVQGGFAFNNNFLYLTAPYLDGNGLSFDVGTFAVNLAYDFGNTYAEYANSVGSYVTLTVIPVPEPASGGLLAGALLGLGAVGAIRRRSRARP